MQDSVGGWYDVACHLWIVMVRKKVFERKKDLWKERFG